MKQMQDDLIIGTTDEAVVAFTHDLLAEQHIEQSQTSQEMFERILELVETGQSGILLVQGPMGAGKTGVSKTLATLLAERYDDKTIALYRFNDNRANADEVFDRDNTALSSRVNIRLVEIGGIQSIFHDVLNIIPANSIVFLSEGQFFGNQSQLEYLAQIAGERNIILCFDCLNAWYSGIPIGETQYIANLAGSNVWNLKACDSFAPDGRADVSMRSVILKEDGTYWEDTKENESAIYMNGKVIEERLRFISYINQSTDPIIRRLKLKDPLNGNMIYLIPSHPTQDAPYVLGGNERYKPTNFKTIIRICELLGLFDLREAYLNIYKTYYLQVDSDPII